MTHITEDAQSRRTTIVQGLRNAEDYLYAKKLDLRLAQREVELAAGNLANWQSALEAIEREILEEES